MFKNWSVIVLGVLLFAFHSYGTNSWTIKNHPEFVFWFGFIAASLKPFGTVVFSIGIINLLAPSFMRVVWRELVKPKIDELANDVKGDLKDISNESKKNLSAISQTAKEHLENIDKVIGANLDRMTGAVCVAGEDIKKFTKESTKKIPITECESRDDFCSHMDAAAKGAFGSKTEETNSLYSFLKNRLLESCCQMPYRHNVNKRITLEKKEGLDGYVQWIETTDYKIHHITWPESKNESAYEFNMTISSYAPSLEIEEYNENASLIIYKDNKTEFDCRTESPEYRKDTESKGFFCWKSGDWVKIRYCGDIKLSGEWTGISVNEVSINSEDDMLYSMHTTRPIYGHSVAFELPEGYSFIGHPYLSSKIMTSGLPNHIDKRHILEKIVVEKSTERQIYVKIDDWILPGIMMDFNWKKQEQG